ncbi:HAD-IIA family hydrolase [Nesterenkonia salmonea]|uniref:HAD-IIA family hydrolase n=1 Tax=Nesterenkonia salmonea TaxID=1804987 RepID=A0A5R9B819_9MICC|nr:HAD-IIA family hydrolase [Nesterenkonia salmonea]TLP93872.1 HAD-IIA family hydrolase [Nesterenkonia salmonea]
MALIDHHDGVLFDLDGVLYAGPEAIPGAPEALAELSRRGRQCAFVTNNASRSAADIAEHLVELGIPAHADQVYGSAPAGIKLMSSHVPAPAKVLVTGSDSLRALCRQAGYTVVESAEDAPDAVIQGFEPTIGWTDLAEASYAINRGAQWFATNLDRSVPRERGIAPANGALAEAISFATGQRPRAAGKPEPEMFAQAAEALNLSSPLVIGDRLDTDILGGNRAGFTTALVLTGATTEAEARRATGDEKPDTMLSTLADLFSGENPTPGQS